MAIRNDPRKVPKNTRLKQKKTAKLLNVPLPPRHPDHPSVKRLMRDYRYERRMDLDTHTLGALFEMRKPERSGNWIHKCATLGMAGTAAYGNLQVVVCKHHINKPPGRWLQPYGQHGCGALWLKEFYPRGYDAWRKNVYDKEKWGNHPKPDGRDAPKYERIVSFFIEAMPCAE